MTNARTGEQISCHSCRLWWREPSTRAGYKRQAYADRGESSAGAGHDGFDDSTGDFNGDGVWGQAIFSGRRLGGRCEMHSHEILAQSTSAGHVPEPTSSRKRRPASHGRQSAPQVSSRTVGAL